MTLFSIPYKDTLVPIYEVHGDHYFSDDGRVFTKMGQKYQILFDNKYIIHKGQVVRLSMQPSGLWKDQYGTIVDVINIKDVVDPVDRCGVGFFSLSKDNSLNATCSVHDHQYSSTTYQAFNSRKDADKALAISIMNKGYPILGNVFYVLSRVFGRFFWENSKTR